VAGLAAVSLAAGCGTGALHDGSPDGPQEVTTGVGATSGALTISGHLRDASGNAIVGARVRLSGDAIAIRSSNFTGGFVFHVDPGPYGLSVSGDCSFSSPLSSLGRLTESATVDFDATSAGCMTSTPFDVTPNGEMLMVGPPDGYTGASVFQYDAGTYLDLVASEIPGASVRRVLIAGDPAVEYTTLLTKPGPQVDPRPVTVRTLVTAIVSGGSDVTRFDTQLPPDATADAIQRYVDAARSFTREETAELHGLPP